jgi:hypothetical protein
VSFAFFAFAKSCSILSLNLSYVRKKYMSTIFLRIFSYAYLLAPQESPLCSETMSQFAERVIPDESDCGGRDPVSSGFPLFPWIPDIHLRQNSGMTASPTLPSGEPAAQNHPTYSMDSGMT